MSDSIFLDTNILVYAHTDLDTAKQSVAQKLITENPSIISTQVLHELANILSKKFKFPWTDVLIVLEDATINSNLYINTENTIRKACQIASRYKFSFYDSLIISATLVNDCSILYSEDLQNNQIIEGKLTVKNPFK